MSQEKQPKPKRKRKKPAKPKAELTEAQLQRDVLRYQICLAKSLAVRDILRETGWSIDRLLRVQRCVAEQSARLAERSPESVFAAYESRQLALVRQLEEIGESCQASGYRQGAIMAAKARSEILDRIEKLRTEIGVVPRAPQELRIEANIMALTEEEARERLRQEIELSEMLLNAPTIDPTSPMGKVEARWDKRFKEGDRGSGKRLARWLAQIESADDDTDDDSDSDDIDAGGPPLDPPDPPDYQPPTSDGKTRRAKAARLARGGQPPKYWRKGGSRR